jgi:dTDP-4-dehydrorhamnose 3,5-epimerase
MRFEALEIFGAMRVQLAAHVDVRGLFGRLYCAREFEQQTQPFQVVQASLSVNPQAGTLRGLHFQWSPSREDKLVRCLRGRLMDVLLDLRPESPSYLQHQALVLAGEARDGVYIPHGVAHGFQTLEDATEVLYMMSDYYAPELQAGVRWDDPVFAIRWPLTAPVMSDRDRELPRFDRQTFERELASRRGAQARA